MFFVLFLHFTKLLVVLNAFCTITYTCRCIRFASIFMKNKNIGTMHLCFCTRRLYDRLHFSYIGNETAQINDTFQRKSDQCVNVDICHPSQSGLFSIPSSPHCFAWGGPNLRTNRKRKSTLKLPVLTQRDEVGIQK